MCIKKVKEDKGITLIALIITIIVLLILAGITLKGITGDESIINNTNNNQELADISIATKNIEEAYSSASILRKDIDKTFELNLKNLIGQDIVLVKLEEKKYGIIDTKKDRVYNMDKENVSYIGKITDGDAFISTVNKENQEEAKIGEFSLKGLVLIVNETEDSNVKFEYAWETSKETEPSQYNVATINSKNAYVREFEINSLDITKPNDYYLWVKTTIKGKENLKKYGPYKFYEYTNLKKYDFNSSGDTETSRFLDSPAEITRGNIKSIEFVRGIDGYNLADGYWDISEQQNGGILAWYTKEGNFYNIKIGEKEGKKINANNDSQGLFKNIGYNFQDEIKIIGLKNLNTENTTNMKSMFENCKKLKKIDTNKFDTSKVTSFNALFSGCIELVDINSIANWDVSKVEDMYGVFLNCVNLSDITALANWNTKSLKRTIMCFALQNNIFQTYGLGKIKDFSPLNNWDMSKVTTINQMFKAQGMEKINVFKNWKMSLVEDMGQLFEKCQNLEKVDFSNSDLSKVTTMKSMFNNCTNLKELNLTGINTPNLTDVGQMFINCKNLVTEINITKNDITLYKNIFQNTATEPGALVKVNYTNNTSTLVNNMIATKSTNSNVIKGKNLDN